MRLTMMKGKIHRATVTGADLSYEGSISIDPKLCKAAGLKLWERVDVYNCNNGARFSTYVIHGGPGQICLNGAAARHAMKGDLVIVAAYCEMEEAEADRHTPKCVFVDEYNRIRSERPEIAVTV
jgi:aspartate 1-decarboxylase